MTIIFALQLNNDKEQTTQAAQFHVEHPKPGFYIDHLDIAKVDREFLKIQAKIEKGRQHFVL